MKLLLVYDPQDVEPFAITSHIEWLDSHIPLERTFYWQRENQLEQSLEAFNLAALKIADSVLLFCSPASIQNPTVAYILDFAIKTNKFIVPIYRSWDAIPPNLRSYQSLEYNPENIETFRNTLYHILAHSPTIVLPPIDLSTRPENERLAIEQTIKEIRQHTVNDRGHLVNAQIWVKLGTLLENVGDTIRTEMAYRTAIFLNPNEAQAWARLGALLKNARRPFPEIEWALRKAIEVNPRDALSWANLGEILFEMKKDVARAEKCFKKSLELNPQSAKGWMNLGNLIKQGKKEYVDAETCYRKATETAPNDAIAWNSLGVVLYENMKNFVEAEKCFRKAIELNSRYTHAWLNLSAYYLNVKKDATEAERCFQIAKQLQGN